MRPRATAAVVASFSMYFVPLWDPPLFSCWGCYFLELLSGRLEPPDPLKLAAFLFVSAVWQSSTGLVVWWFLRRPGWLRAPALPAVAVALTVASSYFPAVFLTVAPWFDRETAAEKTDLPVECTVPRSFLAPTRPMPGNPLGAAGEALLSVDWNLAVLSMPGCVVRSLNIPAGTAIWPAPSVLPGGIALYQVAGGDFPWWVVGGAGPEPEKLEAPPKSGTPTLSSDGQWIAWPLPALGQKPSVMIRRLGGTGEIVVPVAIRWSNEVEVLHLDMQHRTITVFDFSEGFRSMTLDGTPRWGPVYPNPRHVLGTILLAEDVGWLVPHVKRGDDAWFFPWSSSGARINLGLRRGQTLHSVAIDPTGRFLAVRGGETGGATVTALRIRDRHVVFRRYLPRMVDAPVAFLGDRFFAYSEPHEVRVLRLPEP